MHGGKRLRFVPTPDSEQPQRGGDGDEATDDEDDTGALDPQGAVEPSLKGFEIGLEVGPGGFEVGLGGEWLASAAVNLDDGADLLVVEAGVTELVRGGERVEGGPDYV